MGDENGAGKGSRIDGRPWPTGFGVAVGVLAGVAFDGFDQQPWMFAVGELLVIYPEGSDVHGEGRLMAAEIAHFA